MPHCHQWELGGIPVQVCEPSELPFGVVLGVGRGIAVLDGGPRHARGGFEGFVLQFLLQDFLLCSSKRAAWSILRTARHLGHVW